MMVVAIMAAIAMATVAMAISGLKLCTGAIVGLTVGVAVGISSGVRVEVGVGIGDGVGIGVGGVVGLLVGVGLGVGVRFVCVEAGCTSIKTALTSRSRLIVIDTGLMSACTVSSRSQWSNVQFVFGVAWTGTSAPLVYV